MGSIRFPNNILYPSFRPQSLSLKGTKMPGHMGTARRTARNLAVVRVDEENDLLLVKGSVPGPNGGYLMIRRSLKD